MTITPERPRGASAAQRKALRRLSKQVQVELDNDRRYFARHPLRSHYIRRPYPAERAQIELINGNSPPDRQQIGRHKDPLKSRIANGSELLPGVDGRSLWARRLRELLHEHVTALGGEDNISPAELALLRRAITLIVECERREVEFAKAGQVSDAQLSVYQTSINTLRRTLEALGLQRRSRDVTPSLAEILRSPPPPVEVE
jgi:hypothetical protein